MFAKATSNFVRQIDPDGTLIPVSRCNDSDKLVPMALVVKRNRFWFWQKPKYQPSDFTLSHLLLGDTELCPDVSEIDPFLSYEGKFGDTLSRKVDAKAGTVSLNVEGRGTSKLQSSFGRLKKQDVDIRRLLLDSNDRMVDMQHVLVQQMEKRAEVFGVLKERILTTSPCSITETSQDQGTCGVMAVLGKLGSKPVEVCVEEESSVLSDSDVSVTIPPRTVIAYSLVELEVKKDGHYELCLQPGTLGGFEADSPSLESFDTLCVVDGPEWMEGNVPEGVPLSALQTELQKFEKYLLPLAVLSESTRLALFQSLCEVLVDRNTLTVLEHMLEEWCRGETSNQTEELALPQNKSVCALLDLLQPAPTDPIQADRHTTPRHLTAVHLLVSAIQALPDAALILLGECSSDVLQALNTLMTRLKVNGQSLPTESLPLPLQDDKAFHWAEELLCLSNVRLWREKERLWAETGSKQGVFPLVLYLTVQGLTYLCSGQK